MDTGNERSIEQLTVAANQNPVARDYWLKQLAGHWVKSRFFEDPRYIERVSGRKCLEWEPVAIDFTGREMERLLELGNNSDNRLYMVLLAGVFILLNKYTGSMDMVIGSPVYRQAPGVSLINTVLPLRVQLLETMTVKQLILEVRRIVTEAVEHYQYPMELLPGLLNRPGSTDGFPLFDLALMLENIHEKNYLHYTRPALLFYFNREERCLQGRVEYNPAYYERVTVKRIAVNLQVLFSRMIFQIDQEISQLDLLSEEERRQVLCEFNQTTVLYPADKTFHLLFEEQVERTPQRIGLIRGEQALSYHELNRHANRLAWVLRQKGVSSDQVVGLLMDRSMDMIIGLLAILKAGGAYMPIDTAYPVERVGYMLENSHASFLVTRHSLGSDIHFQGQMVDIGQVEQYPVDRKKEINLSPINHPGHMVYVIYTSGTTGNPKGVMIRHESLVNAAYAWRDAYRLHEMEVHLLQVAGFSFDVFSGDVARVFPNGGEMVICPEDIRLDHLLLLSFLQKHRITLLESIPSLVIPFMDYVYETRVELNHLRLLIMGSDVLRAADFKTLLSRFGKKMRIINSYGITEATIDSSFYENRTGEMTADGVVPIGKPMANMRCYILDSRRQPVPIGGVGELYIGGKGVAAGYINNTVLTLEKFISLKAGTLYLPSFPLPADIHPLTGDMTLYRTGDLARWLPDGNIDFLGRQDHQVKIRGYRIEPEEIQKRLEEFPGVKHALVADREKENGEKYLCAYLVMVPGKPMIQESIREYLRQQLPLFMVPAYFVQLNQFPLTANGKIDRKSLPEPGLNLKATLPFLAQEMITPIGSYPNNRLLHHWFEEQVEKKPGNIALVGPNAETTLTYQELNQEANIFAQVLINLGVKPGEIVGLLSQHSFSLIVAILAIIKAGAVYLPMDPENPPERIGYFMDDCASRFLLTTGQFLESYRHRYQVIDLEDKTMYTAYDDSSSHSNTAKDNKRDIHIEPDRPLYVAYTSGSTGKPKGVRITHGNLCPLLHWGHHHLHLTADDRVAQNLSYFFDWSVWEIFITLTTGARLVVVPADTMLEPATYIDFLQAHHVTVLHMTPTQFQILIGPGRTLDTLTYLCLGAEKLTVDRVERALPLLRGDCRIFNMYGPTEATIIAAVLELDRDPSAIFEYRQLSSVPIGSTVGNNDLLVLDEQLEICPDKMEGELYIAGDGVAGGYLNNPVLTSERFIKADQLKLPGYRNVLYKTGDRVKRLADGNIEFTGRIDHQVKISGLRIELGEIDSVLLEYQNIKGATTILKEDETGHKSICSFILTEMALDQEQLRKFLSERLPYYMVPTAVIALEKMPLNRNGKIDRNALLRYAMTTHTAMSYVTSEMFAMAVTSGENQYPLADGTGEPVPPVAAALTGEEMYRLLEKLNDTYSDYPQDKIYYQLFAEQVQKTPGRIALVYQDSFLTYAELNQQANRLASVLYSYGVTADTIVGLMVERSLELMIGILGVLKAGGAFMPIDPTEPDERKLYLLEDSRVSVVLVAKKETTVPVPTYLLKTIFIDKKGKYTGAQYPAHPVEVSGVAGPTDLSHLLYTSGSTGKPKGVLLENRGVVNLMFAMADLFDFRSSDSVLSVTPEVFDVFIAEVLYPLSQGIKLVIAASVVIQDYRAVAAEIVRTQVTVLFSCPFMLQRMVSDPGCVAQLQGLKYFLVAGEPLLESLQEKLQVNETVKIFNLYGPTETTVYSTGREVSRGHVDIGKPLANTQVYILAKTGEPQPVGVAGELYIGGVGVARGYLNQPGLTAERFIHHPVTRISSQKGKKNPLVSHDILYKTGDLARWLADGNLEFIGRMDHQVKIGGIRIEPGEIENFLFNYPGVHAVAVVPRRHRKGSREYYLGAFIVAEKALAEQELRDYLSALLPPFMVPAFFVQLEKMPLTVTGKVDRKLLAGIDIERPEASTDAWVTPGDRIEEKVAQVWIEALGLKNESLSHIDINANFFESGGHSLIAASLIVKLHKIFNVRVPMMELFKTPTIKGLSDYIKAAGVDIQGDIEPVEWKEYYLLSPAQKRFYILQQMETDSTAYNMPKVLYLEGDIDMNTLHRVFQQLMQRHEALRTSIELVDDQPVQRVHQEPTFNIEYIRLHQENEHDHPLDQVIQGFVRPFDLGCAPLTRVAFIKTGQSRDVLIIDTHHIILDGVSAEILARDLVAIYNNENLLPLKLQYKDYAEWQVLRQRSEVMKQQGAFWVKEFTGELPVLNLPIDHDRPLILDFIGTTVHFEIGAEETRALKKLARDENVTLYMVMLAIYNVMLAKITGQDDIIVGITSAGRRHAELDEIIGVFINTLPFRSQPKSELTFHQFLKAIKQKTLKALENQDYSLDDLVEKLALKRISNRNPLFDTAFEFFTYTTLKNENSPDLSTPLSKLQVEDYGYEKQQSAFDLTLAIKDVGQNLLGEIEYAVALFEPSTIESIIVFFHHIIQQVLENPGLEISAIALDYGMEIGKSREKSTDIVADFDY